MSKIRDDTGHDDHDGDEIRDAHDTPPPGDAAPEADTPIHLHSPARGRRLARKATPAPTAKAPSTGLTYEQRLLVLDLWRRSSLPAGDFAPLVGLSKYTLYEWKRRFEADGPAGLADRPRGSPQGSRLPEVTRRTIVMLKQSHPDWGLLGGMRDEG